MCECVSVCPETFGESTVPILMKLSKNGYTKVKRCEFEFWAIQLTEELMAAILSKKRQHCVYESTEPFGKIIESILTKLSK